MKKIFALVGAGIASLAGVSAHAALDLPTALSVADVETMAGLVVGGLAVMWGIRKVIKLTNRS